MPRVQSQLDEGFQRPVSTLKPVNSLAVIFVNLGITMEVCGNGNASGSCAMCFTCGNRSR